MTIKIVISASQQWDNKCAYSEDCTEQKHCHAIADMVSNVLKKDDRFSVLKIPLFEHMTRSEYLFKAVAMSNEFIGNDKGYHLCIHTDGGYFGDGASGLYYSEAGLCFIREIYNEVSELWQSNEGLKQRTNLYELKQTKAIAGIIELGFHDRKDVAKIIHEKMESFVCAIVRGIYKACGLIYSTTYSQQAVTPQIEQKMEQNIEQWKIDGAKFLKDMGYINDYHNPLEVVDIGTLGTIIKNIKVKGL